MNDRDIKTEYIECGCGREIMQIDFDKKWKTFDIAFYEAGLNEDNRYNWKYKLRYCWKVLTTGQPYSDQVVLSKEEAEKFANFVNENLKEK